MKRRCFTSVFISAKSWAKLFTQTPCLIAQTVMYNIFVLKYVGIVGLLAVAGMFMLNSDAVQHKMAQKGRDGSSYEIRQADNLAMLTMTMEKPIVGYGLLSNEFRQRGRDLGNLTSSNGLLSISSQMGIPFFVCILIALYSSLKKFFPKNTFLEELVVLSLHSTEVFFYFPISFFFLFNRKDFGLNRSKGN
jgi:hypothetical protein